LNNQKKEESSSERLRNFLNLTSRPPPYVVDQQQRLRQQFILGLTVIAFPILVFAQFVSSEGLFGFPIFLILAFFIFIGLILSRYGYLNLAIIIDILSFSFYPYISLVIKDVWTLDYSFLVLIWIPITMLIGGYLLNQRYAGILILIHDIVFLAVVLTHPGASILMSSFLETAIPLFAISLMIYVGSWARQRHIDQLAQLNHELDARNQEMKIYASLLVHDLGNDIQQILMNSELAAQLLETDPTNAREHLLTSISIEKKMSALLKVFSEPQITIQSDIVSLIENIADEAERTYRNLKVCVKADEQGHTYGVVSRLIPMVFTNLLQNCALHAGENPVANVEIVSNLENLEIRVIDNGPGVDPTIRQNLFEKGISGTKHTGSGMGLYLVKQIIEIHNGEIILLDEHECEGCGFRIILPDSSFVELS
jgi:signal transduction histidine kinase